MTRETAIDILQSANLVGVLREAADIGIDAIHSSMWINVKDKLPKSNKHPVLIVLNDNTVQFATNWLDWPDGHVSFYIPRYDRWLEATHWMNLPKTPKEDSNGYT